MGFLCLVDLDMAINVIKRSVSNRLVKALVLFLKPQDFQKSFLMRVARLSPLFKQGVHLLIVAVLQDSPPYKAEEGQEEGHD